MTFVFTPPKERNLRIRQTTSQAVALSRQIRTMKDELASTTDKDKQAMFRRMIRTLQHAYLRKVHAIAKENRQ